MGNPDLAEINKATRITSETAKELGSRGGKAKAGSKHLSTIIREIGENIDWNKTTLKNKDELQKLYGKNGWQAIIYVAVTKAISGDTKAMDWLAKNSFGTKLDLTTNGKDLPTPILGGVAKDVSGDTGDVQTSQT